ncbi:hypothetical protein H696_02117 [Fonticula alba]|uniref:Tubulin-specific chaperone D C-terminal domain-containing protein n=1 Tax=Fonticula alba TaxID=691883 RepID=A0A058ZB56_FONAL|nr:hypothetical protein H696_02117 [Fonticula alba]KCV71166.1 hypothetical protein H696_02117 [Fonticula alba]|eukprot:XP_009494289.1 hypothetical protein H696_02117 [Fonticula alba]
MSAPAAPRPAEPGANNDEAVFNAPSYFRESADFMRVLYEVLERELPVEWQTPLLPAPEPLADRPPTLRFEAFQSIVQSDHQYICGQTQWLADVLKVLAQCTVHLLPPAADTAFGHLLSVEARGAAAFAVSSHGASPFVYQAADFAEVSQWASNICLQHCFRNLADSVRGLPLPDIGAYATTCQGPYILDSGVRMTSAKCLAVLSARLAPVVRLRLVADLLDAVAGPAGVPGRETLLRSHDANLLHGVLFTVAEATRRDLSKGAPGGPGLSEELVALLARLTGVACDALTLTVDHFPPGPSRPALRRLVVSVRDTACFLAWALSRHPHPSYVAFEHPVDGQPGTGDRSGGSAALLWLLHGRLARELLAAALFDVSVSIRRGAAAAFQELAGRSSGWALTRGGVTVAGGGDSGLESASGSSRVDRIWSAAGTLAHGVLLSEHLSFYHVGDLRLIERQVLPSICSFDARLVYLPALVVSLAEERITTGHYGDFDGASARQLRLRGGLLLEAMLRSVWKAGGDGADSPGDRLLAALAGHLFWTLGVGPGPAPGPPASAEALHGALCLLLALMPHLLARYRLAPGEVAFLAVMGCDSFAPGLLRQTAALLLAEGPAGAAMALAARRSPALARLWDLVPAPVLGLACRVLEFLQLAPSEPVAGPLAGAQQFEDFARAADWPAWAVLVGAAGILRAGRPAAEAASISNLTAFLWGAGDPLAVQPPALATEEEEEEQEEGIPGPGAAPCLAQAAPLRAAFPTGAFVLGLFARPGSAETPGDEAAFALARQADSVAVAATAAGVDPPAAESWFAPEAAPASEAVRLLRRLADLPVASQPVVACLRGLLDGFCSVAPGFASPYRQASPALARVARVAPGSSPADLWSVLPAMVAGCWPAVSRHLAADQAGLDHRVLARAFGLFSSATATALTKRNFYFALGTILASTDAAGICSIPLPEAVGNGGPPEARLARLLAQGLMDFSSTQTQGDVGSWVRAAAAAAAIPLLDRVLGGGPTVPESVAPAAAQLIRALLLTCVDTVDRVRLSALRAVRRALSLVGVVPLTEAPAGRVPAEVLTAIVHLLGALVDRVPILPGDLAGAVAGGPGGVPAPDLATVWHLAARGAMVRALTRAPGCPVRKAVVARLAEPQAGSTRTSIWLAAVRHPAATHALAAAALTPDHPAKTVPLLGDVLAEQLVPGASPASPSAWAELAQRGAALAMLAGLLWAAGGPTGQARASAYVGRCLTLSASMLRDGDAPVEPCRQVVLAVAAVALPAFTTTTTTTPAGMVPEGDLLGALAALHRGLLEADSHRARPGSGSALADALDERRRLADQAAALAELLGG